MYLSSGFFLSSTELYFDCGLEADAYISSISVNRSLCSWFYFGAANVIYVMTTWSLDYSIQSERFGFLVGLPLSFSTRVLWKVYFRSMF